MEARRYCRRILTARKTSPNQTSIVALVRGQTSFRAGKDSRKTKRFSCTSPCGFGGPGHRIKEDSIGGVVRRRSIDSRNRFPSTRNLQQNRRGRDGRVAEGARLESVFTRKGNVGSNPRWPSIRYVNCTPGRNSKACYLFLQEVFALAQKGITQNESNLHGQPARSAGW